VAPRAPGVARGVGWDGRRDRLGKGERQGLALQFRTDDLQAVVDETEAILQAGDNHALDAGKRRGAPVGTVDAAVVACRRQAANVTLAAVVIRRHLRVVEEG